MEGKRKRRKEERERIVVFVVVKFDRSLGPNDLRGEEEEKERGREQINEQWKRRKRGTDSPMGGEQIFQRRSGEG